MVTKTRPMITIPQPEWEWEAALLNIWHVIHGELVFASSPQLTIQCNEVTLDVDDQKAFVNYYLGKLRAHDENKGCFMLTVNVRDMWGIIHQKRRWAFVSKDRILEEK